MHSERIKSGDGLNLTYYLNKNSGPAVVILNSVQSIHWWLPLIDSLKDDFTILCMDYRGFTGFDRILTDREADFDNLVNDLELVLKVENIDRAHFVAWCNGGKIMLEYYKRNQNTFLSMLCVPLFYEKGHKFYRDTIDFSDEKKIDAMVRALRLNPAKPNTGAVFQFENELNAINGHIARRFKNGFQSHGAMMLNVVTDGKSMINYMKISDSIGVVDLTDMVQKVAVPCAIFHGSRDTVVPVQRRYADLYSSNKNISYEIIDNGSHYLVIEEKERITGKIREHARIAHH